MDTFATTKHPSDVMWRTIRTIYRIFRESGTMNVEKLREMRSEAQRRKMEEMKTTRAFQLDEERLILGEMRRNLEGLLKMQKRMKQEERQTAKRINEISKKALDILEQNKKARGEDVMKAFEHELKLPGSRIAQYVFDGRTDEKDKHPGG